MLDTIFLLHLAHWVVQLVDLGDFNGGICVLFEADIIALVKSVITDLGGDSGG